MTISKQDLPDAPAPAQSPSQNALETHAMDCFEQLVKGSAHKLLVRLDDLLDVINLDNDQSIEQRAENIELFISELSRSIRAASLDSTINSFLERVQLDLELHVPMGENGEKEPLELIARRVMDSQLVVGLPDRVFEILLPVTNALISIRGFVHNLLSSEELDELAHKKALTDLREEFQLHRTMVDRRIQVSVSG